MSHEIHVTRGNGFGEPGDEPLTRRDWEAVLAAHPEIIVGEPESNVGRLGGKPIVFEGGVIAMTSPDATAFAVLRKIAESLGARVFGEDDMALGVDVVDEVRATIRAAFPDMDTSHLTEDAARALGIVSEGGVHGPRSALEEAVTACCRLQGPLAELGLTYLLCRAVECGGEPPASTTVVAAHLLPCRPTRVVPFRTAPTTAWVKELEALHEQLQKRPGTYVIRRCHACGAKNRMPLFAPNDNHPTCGRCKTALAALV